MASASEIARVRDIVGRHASGAEIEALIDAGMFTSSDEYDDE